MNVLQRAHTNIVPEIPAWFYVGEVVNERILLIVSNKSLCHANVTSFCLYKAFKSFAFLHSGPRVGSIQKIGTYIRRYY